jgi:Family of unknown function (DUF6516)
VTDRGLENLLDLDGETFQLDRGYWTKFEVRRVKPSVEVPHGIRYSLTLHDQHGKRLFGFDNAHAIPKAHKYGARRVEWDHKHAEERVTAYFYTDSGRLLQDFWGEVSKLLEA